ncbi:MAG: tRNA preQ1(34) S-adenosylmethionine ribosyltransferase-isomerase QueA [Eubacteriaceae bacterium]|nr:tRNA preQ1(34) S-adenosylmethionine ribosyltransferase-isomerase QueA [Eubacteriaceae bacterium]
MKTSDFYYELPKELIAQYPSARRDQSLLMVINRTTGAIAHRRFYDLVDYLQAGDCLVFNDSKVIRARLLGKKQTGAKVETLLIKHIEKNFWQALIKPLKRLKENDIIMIEQDFQIKLLQKNSDGTCVVELMGQNDMEEQIERYGKIPLPPYIVDDEKKYDRYQTVYAKNPGSVAAPTAGLHFSPNLLDKLKEKKISQAFLTLHVGIDTFRPVKEEYVEEHKMHREYYHISKESADVINQTKESGGRVIPVGTTAMRTLEGCMKKHGKIIPVADSTDIYIYPPYHFQIADALITNFHLPQSTLLMLVSAFYDREKLLDAYVEAIEQKYRFFSFGDAMFLHS